MPAAQFHQRPNQGRSSGNGSEGVLNLFGGEIDVHNPPGRNSADRHNVSFPQTMNLSEEERDFIAKESDAGLAKRVVQHAGGHNEHCDKSYFDVFIHACSRLLPSPRPAQPSLPNES